MSEEKKAPKKSVGISISRTKVSMAFTLITFMITELIMLERSIPAPLDLERYNDINEENFVLVKTKMFDLLGTAEKVELNLKESVFLYIMVDMACKCFVSDINPQLKEMAGKNLELDGEQYDQVRMSYLHFAQSLIEQMIEKLDKEEEFKKAHDKLQTWKS